MEKMESLEEPVRKVVLHVQVLFRLYVCKFYF